MSEQAPITVAAAGLSVTLDKDIVHQIVRQVVEQILEAHDESGRLGYCEHEAARLLGIPKHRLRDARLRGEIRAGKIGKLTMYSRRQLLAYLERSGDEQ